MSNVTFLTRTFLAKFYLCCFGFCLCLVTCESNSTTTRVRNVAEIPVDKNQTASYEEYDTGDRDLLFDNFKVYEDNENIEKGIRKLDTSVEIAAAEKAATAVDAADETKSRNVTSAAAENGTAALVENAYDSYEKSEPIDEDDFVDTNDEGGVFEDSDAGAGSNKANISGTLVTKLIPEILKYNGRMVMPSADENADGNGRRERKTEANEKSVIQKLSPRRIRQESSTVPEIVSSAFYARNASRLEDIFDLYNPYRLADVWRDNVALEKVTSICRNHVELFLIALRRGDSWALKMWDASGHYGGSYFWGNPYWMGSRMLCREIFKTENALPFQVEFSVARINISFNLPSIRKYSRSQSVGICLPYVCNKHDVHVLVTQSMISSNAEDDRKAEVIRIKSHYDYYYMAHDPTFWLVVISSVLITALLVFGTVLDLYITKRKKFCRAACIPKNFKYDNYTYAVNPPIQSYTDNGKIEIEGCIAGLWQEVLLSFSVVRNLRQICDSTIGADTIPIIHGLRSISMAWVILGHTCIVAFKYSDNMEFRKVVERELLFQTINNATFTVDTFFFISGLLVSFLYFRTMAKVNVNKITKTTGFLSHCIEFIGLLGYRFCRLTIPYVFTLQVVEISMKWFNYNSVFDPPADDHINCPNYWWRNLLYINTLFPVKDMCMLWSWYLADDTQFYILGVVLLILAVRHFRAASVSVVALLVISWCTTGYIAYLNNHMPNVDDPLALFDKIYDKPWTRFGPYLIGMIVGWILFKTDCKISMRKPVVTIGWILCAFAMLCLVYGLYKTQLNSVTAAAYSSLSHTIWAVGLSWIVVACTTGHGGYANTLLSSKLLIPFSRTTYCAYLIHPIIIRWVVMRRDSPVHLAEETIAVMFLGQLVTSYILAFLLSITFEAPIVSLLKIVSPTKRNKLQ